MQRNRFPVTLKLLSSSLVLICPSFRTALSVLLLDTLASPPAWQFFKMAPFTSADYFILTITLDTLFLCGQEPKCPDRFTVNPLLTNCVSRKNQSNESSETWHLVGSACLCFGENQTLFENGLFNNYKYARCKRM